jgi:hypothetical protein
MRKIYLTLLFYAIVTITYSQIIHSDTSKRWYAPTHVSLQFAGGQGFLSAGAGYDFFNDHLSFDVMVGYLPQSIGGISIWSINSKTTYKPWILPLGQIKEMSVAPFYFGLNTMHAIGEQYTKFKKSGDYPQGYYWWPNSTRIGFAFGQNYYYNLNPKAALHTMEFYWSVSADDLGLYSYFENKIVKRKHIYTLDFGLKAYF